MKKTLRYVLMALVVVLLLLAGAIGYFVATFNPDEYKTKIIHVVKDKQQRELKLDGDIRLTIFPDIGAKMEKISLSERNSNRRFAAVENMRVSFAVLPLLAGKFVVSEVALRGVKAKIVKFKDGGSNFDDLLAVQEQKADLREPENHEQGDIAYDIAKVEVENGELSYRDEAAGTHYKFSNLNVKTGRMVYGVPSKIHLDALIQSSKPSLDIETRLDAELVLAPGKKFYQAKDLDMEIKGKVLDISKLLLTMTGNASADLATLEFKAKKFRAYASGVIGGDSFKTSADIPELNFTKDKVDAQKLLVNAQMDGEWGKLLTVLSMQEMQGNGKSFKGSDLALDVDVKQAVQAFKLKMTTPFVGSMEAKQLNLSNIVLALSATGDKLPGKSASSEMKGSLQLDAERESVQLNLAGGLLNSQVKAKFALKGFTEPALRFDLDADQFDADFYIPKKAEPEVKNEEIQPEKPFDLSALKKLNLQGSLRLDSLKIGNIKANKLRVDVRANDGMVKLSPISVSMYQGEINGSVEVDVSNPLYVFTLKQNLSGVQLGPLLKDMAEMEIVEGKGNVLVNLGTQGNTVSALKKNLNGTLALNLADGAIKGVDLGKLALGAQNPGQGDVVQTIKPSPGDKTEYNDLKASFKLNKGVARNDDLMIKSPSLKVTGKGNVDIGNSRINYMAKATVANSADGNTGVLTVPVQLYGPFAELQFKVDHGAVLADIAKQKARAEAKAKKAAIKERLQKKPKDGLKGQVK